MKKGIRVLLAVCGLLCVAASAEAIEEDWYFHLQLGFPGGAAHPEFVEAEVKAAESMNGPMSGGGAEFELGFYWALGDERNDLLGFTLFTGFSTTYSGANQEDSENLTVMTSLGFVSASYMCFFGEEVGVGPFVRADLGLAPYISISNDFTDSYSMKSADYGYSIGGGYGWLPETWQTRVLLHLRFTEVVYEGESSSAAAMGVGFMF